VEIIEEGFSQPYPLSAEWFHLRALLEIQMQPTEPTQHAFCANNEREDSSQLEESGA
jgi:hypothetical protein